MELIIAFIIAVILAVLASRPETLAEYSERMNVNRLANESKKRKAPGMRRACRYIQAGWRPERHG